MARNLYAYEYVPRSGREIVDVIRADPAVLVGPTDRAVARAESVRSRLRFEVGSFEVGRDVVVEIGQPQVEPGSAHIPVRWRSASASNLFPHLEALIEVESISDDPPEARVSLSGSYTPPLGALGVVADLLLGQKVAEATVREFISALAGRLARPGSEVPG